MGIPVTAYSQKTALSRNYSLDRLDNINTRSSKICIDLSCGLFEEPNFAQNDNLSFAKELEKTLGVQGNFGLHAINSKLGLAILKGHAPK